MRRMCDPDPTTGATMADAVSDGDGEQLLLDMALDLASLLAADRRCRMADEKELLRFLISTTTSTAHACVRSGSIRIAAVFNHLNRSRSRDQNRQSASAIFGFSVRGSSALVASCPAAPLEKKKDQVSCGRRATLPGLCLAANISSSSFGHVTPCFWHLGKLEIKKVPPNEVLCTFRRDATPKGK